MSILEHTAEIGMKIDPYYQGQKCRPMTLSFWNYKVHAHIRRGFRLAGSSNESGVVDNGNFCRFEWLLLQKLQK